MLFDIASWQKTWHRVSCPTDSHIGIMCSIGPLVTVSCVAFIKSMSFNLSECLGGIVRPARSGKDRKMETSGCLWILKTQASYSFICSLIILFFLMWWQAGWEGFYIHPQLKFNLKPQRCERRKRKYLHHVSLDEYHVVSETSEHHTAATALTHDHASGF